MDKLVETNSFSVNGLRGHVLDIRVRLLINKPGGKKKQHQIDPQHYPHTAALPDMLFYYNKHGRCRLLRVDPS